MEEGATLHLLANFWRVHGWYATHGCVLARDLGTQSRKHRKGGNSCVQRWTGEYSLRVS